MIVTPTAPAPRTAARRRGRARRRGAALVALALVTALAFVLALGLGPVPIAPGDVVGILFGADAPGAAVVAELRLPRAILALVAGAGLAVAGAAMQAYFRNPLAEPGVTGVASGAAVGAVAVIVLGLDALGVWTRPVSAFCGALVVLLVVQAAGLASRDRGATTVLLVGIAINAFCGAVMGALIANADDPQSVRGATFWLQGDLTTASWADVAIAAGPVLVGCALVVALTREIDALLLGDEIASSLGVDVARVRVLLLVVTSLVVGSIVSVTGVIGFVGLVAPHIVRLTLGADHRVLLPGSVLLGAAFLLAADTVARLAPAGTAWQTGVVTALVGSPVFLVLVLRGRHATRSAS